MTERRPRKGDDIAERLLEFGAAILRLCRTLPKDLAGRHVAGQVIRSGTSAGANYHEARSSESRNDFIHKLGLATKELQETIYWLELIERSAISTNVESLASEADELTAILMASRRTAIRNSRR